MALEIPRCPQTDLLIADPDYNVWDIYLTPRYRDIATVYTSDNPDEIREILDRYNVDYVIIGDMERDRFNMDNTATISSLGSIEFSSGDLMVVKIDRQPA